MVEKLTDKSPLLPLYRTVHEIFTSYGSSFNYFEVIGSVSKFGSRISPPSSIPFRKVTRTNSVTFSCSNWTLSLFIILKEEDFYFFLPNICGSNHDLLIRTRILSRSILLSPFFDNQKDLFQSSLNFWVWNRDSSTAFLFTYFFFYFFFIFFHHSLTPTKFDPVESDPFYHWVKSTK